MRHDNAHEGEFGQDSFLDVVANVVGVLIILVMLIGVRASHSLLQNEPLSESVEIKEAYFEGEQLQEDRVASMEKELEQVSHQAIISQRRFQETVAKIHEVNQVAANQKQHRMEMAMHRSVMESEIANRRSKLTTEAQQEFDVQKQIVEAKIELDKLSKQQISLLSDPGQVEEVEVIPTPVAKRIDQEVVHVRLMRRSLCVVPFYELIGEVQGDMEDIQRQLKNNDQAKLTFGPIDGFRMLLEVQKIPNANSATGRIAGTVSQGDKILPVFTFVETSKSVGENVDQALMPGSEFLRKLKIARRKTSIVVVWLYSDSFDDFRALKESLYAMNYSIATRNLPVGVNIGASPDGSRSAAQ